MNAHSPTRISQRRRTPRALLLVAVVAMLWTSGCADDDLPVYYGRKRMPGASASVNGTDVLAGMFTAAGHKVFFRRSIVTPQMDSVNTIVWFPDDLAAPSKEVLDWMSEWLIEDEGRTLIYVGRDFDAAPIYWRKMTPLVSPAQQAEYARRKNRVFPWTIPKNVKEDELRCEWFKFVEEPVKDVRGLVGPWAEGINAKATEISLGNKLVPEHWDPELILQENKEDSTEFTGSPWNFSVLLTDEKENLLAGEMEFWDEGRIFLIANGSFLLNLPLVNHEHRKLAGKLIDAVGEPGRVVFLESGQGGPPIDPPVAEGSLWLLFGAWPLNVILLHLAVVGILFCFARWPIFGKPREPAAAPLSDFARHVGAVGELLQRTRDRNFAYSKLPKTEDAAPAPGVPPPA